MNNQIKLLTIKGCHDCEQAKLMLDKYGVQYTVVDCDTNPEEIPETIRQEDLAMPFLKVQDNCFLIGSNQEYLKEIIEKILGLV